VVIDDYVPTTLDKTPAFAGITGGGEIWVALVEKAFAKMCTSYAHTQWGLNAHGMHYLCGGEFAASWTRLGPDRWKRSCTVWYGKKRDTIDRVHCEGSVADGAWHDADELWGALRMCMERCYPVACGVDKAKMVATGLLADRSYSMIEAQEIAVEDGTIFRIVCLRNPYGIGEWQGRWSDASEAWSRNPAVKVALGHQKKDDGLFWMSFTDLLKHFDAIDYVRKSMPIQGASCHKVQGFLRGIKKNG